MRRAPWIVAGALILLLAIVLVRTASFTSRQPHADRAPTLRLDRVALAERLARAVRFRTVSYEDPGRSPRAEFEGFLGFLDQSYPEVRGALVREVVGEHSLLLTWPGSEPTLVPVLLAGHLDVVPVEPGSEGRWTHPPFEGRVADGHLWGRGAMDDKGPVLAMLEALTVLLREGFRPTRTVYLAFGHDEEVGGRQGARAIAARLRSRGVTLEYVLDEGLPITLGIIPGVSRPVAAVGIAEKGHVTIELSVDGIAGHTSMPPARTAIGILAEAVHRLEARPMPRQLPGAVRGMFAYLGPEMPLPRRVVFANLWLFGWLIERQLARSAATNALLQTTLAATIFEGGIKDNVLPSRARAVVNARIRPGDSVRTVVAHVRETIGDPRVRVVPREDTASEPSPQSSAASWGFAALERSIREVFPDALVAPSLLIALTDSRHYAPLARDVYRFAPLRFGPADLDRVHGTDERISLENYAELVGFYARLLRNSAS